MVAASPSVAARVIPLRGGWTTVVHIRASSEAAPWDCEVHGENARSAPVPSRALTHRPPVGEPQRRAALCVHGRRGFLFCSREPAWIPRLCLTWRPMSGERRIDFRPPSVVTDRRPSVKLCIGGSTSWHWKRSSKILPVCS